MKIKMIEQKSWQLPSVTWSKEDVAGIVEKYGEKEATRVIAGKVFKYGYAKRIVRMAMQKETALETTEFGSVGSI